MWLWSRTRLVLPRSGLGSGPGLALPRSGSGLRSLHVGQVFTLSRAFSEQDLVQFSALTGDSNPLHLDRDFARTTAFSRPLVHGVLVNALISALLGSNAPGCVLLKQEIRFPAPLFVDELVLARVEVQRIRLSVALVSVRVQTQDQTQDPKVVLEGTVTVKIHRDKQQTQT
ncbi:hydroxyacyl-thioester dehydratase type 2, mitochondrial-like [Eucyclogobius newberryi]|uniref:hydroxyacyl-thioester dehydratase type 2, mitochondrial-like n=1 Tax=Eucyclogobius newberryi TaxID=166745 RepID=UPI003B5CEE71